MQQQDNRTVDDGVSILIVDDARFTCEMIRRALRAVGYYDVRVATTAVEALDLLAQRRADIVLADWLMPGLDGLALTRRIRQQDEDHGHYTYVILLTARDGMDSLTEAFDHGVDDFIAKRPDHQELIARINAAARVAGLQNDLIEANRRLLELNRQLSRRASVDHAAGISDATATQARIDALIRHTEGRGGIGMLGLLRLRHYPRERDAHGDSLDDVLLGIARRLRQTTRPLDHVGRLGEDTFAILMLHQGGDSPHANAFRRTHNALNLRAYKTRGGFLTVNVAMAVCTFQPPWPRPPTPDELLAFTEPLLEESAAASCTIVRAWTG